MKNIQNKCNGFTLAELLIVVAIIAVLVAVSIPIFTSSLSKSREETCNANCRSLKAVLSYGYLDESLSAEDINGVNLTKANDYIYKNEAYRCPSGGDLYAGVSDGKISVRCTYHDDGIKDNSNTLGSVWTNDMVSKIQKVLEKFPPGIDSGAVDGAKRNALIAALEDAGIDLGKLNAKSWKYASSSYGTYFQWTTSDVSKMNVGDPITIIRYRLDGQYGGIYSVWKGKVGEANSNGNKIKVVDASNNSNDEYTGNMDSEEKKDIKNVLPIYNKYN